MGSQEKCQAVASRILSPLPFQRQPLMSAVQRSIARGVLLAGSGWAGGRRLKAFDGGGD